MATKGSREVVELVREMVPAGCQVTYHATRGRHPKVTITMYGTNQDFAVPQEVGTGRSKMNFYSQMRRKIDERLAAVKQRQSTTA